MIALTKRSSGIRGIVVGEILRRLVVRTMAQSLGSLWKTGTAPHQDALTTRSGCELIAHALQGFTDLDPEATVMSVDGVGAFDLISRASMMSAVRKAPGCGDAVPFVLQFQGQPSSYIWEDELGDHNVVQGAGGEQGDPLMPALFTHGQHDAMTSSLLLPQSVWPFSAGSARLLLFCAAARANYLLGVILPLQSESFATVHDSSPVVGHPWDTRDVG